MRNGIAVDEYRKAVAIDPGFALAHYRIAYVGERVDVDAETRRTAIKAAVNGLDRMPAKERLLVQAWKANLEGRPEEASAFYARAAEAFPHDKEVVTAVGEFQYQEGRFAEALPWFERAVDLDPTWEPALANLIETLAALDRAADATRRTAQWTELRPGGESYRALASARLLAGQFPQAVEAGRRALELQGRRRDALGWPSSLSMRVAEGIAAVEEFERGPGNIWRGWRLAELLLGKARAHERLGEPEKAIATVDRLLAGWKHADPDLPRLAEAKALRAHLAASVSSRGRVSKSAFDARRP